MTRKIALLGAGSWGTALAVHAAYQHAEVRLWARDAEQVHQMCRLRQNPRYLPGFAFPAPVQPYDDLGAAVADCPLVVIAVPSRGFRTLLQRLQPLLQPEQRLVWATKGLDPRRGQWLHEVLAEELPGYAPAVLSGPSFAREVMCALPTALTAAAADAEHAAVIVQAFHGHSLRVYRSTDVLGVELGGAFKNVLAIAAGIADGLAFGANARAALITRGLVELQRLGRAVGANPQTLTGLSGLGDLILTCTDNQSRNRRLGLALGQGHSLSTALAAIGQAVEGVETARVAMLQAAQAGVSMPICQEVHAVLYEGRPVQEAVRRLLERDPATEDLDQS